MGVRLHFSQPLLLRQHLRQFLQEDLTFGEVFDEAVQPKDFRVCQQPSRVALDVRKRSHRIVEQFAVEGGCLHHQLFGSRILVLFKQPLAFVLPNFVLPILNSHFVIIGGYADDLRLNAVAWTDVVHPHPDNVG